MNPLNPFGQISTDLGKGILFAAFMAWWGAIAVALVVVTRWTWGVFWPLGLISGLLLGGLFLYMIGNRITISRSESHGRESEQQGPQRDQ